MSIISRFSTTLRDRSGGRVRIADDASHIIGGRLSGRQDGRRRDEARPDDALQGDRRRDFINQSGADRIRARRPKEALRQLVVQPGGVVPWHSHEKRPANIYIISGSITEYRSTCAVPIEHGEGDVASEFGPLAHWWKNNTNKPTVLLSADILPPEMKSDESM